MKNHNLHQAKKAKKDEFYTQLVDIENELKHYRNHFKDKVVYCNCDDPRVSNFFKYFSDNFEFLGIKKLIATCYKNQDINLFSNHKSEKAVYLEYTGDTNSNRLVDNQEIEVKELNGDGDFRSQECIELLKQADIVVTNPPFSLFREYMAQLIEYDKKFLIIGSINNIMNRKTFPHIKTNKIWLGKTYPKKFTKPDKTIKQFGNIGWFTNIEHSKRNEPLILTESYTPEKYPTYDNYDAINVDKVRLIPDDYNGLMGVPISFLAKHNPRQFDIINIDRPLVKELTGRVSRFKINGKEKYARIVIKNKTL